MALLHTGFAPFEALDDDGVAPHPIELGYLERDLARRRGEAALVAAGALRRAFVGALIGRRQAVGCLVEHGVDGLLDGFPDQLVE